MESIILSSEDGQDLEVFVLEETMLSGIKYLLVAEDEEGDSDAYILKAIEEENEEVVYEMVDDDLEFSAVAKLFEELVGDEADFEF